MTDIRLLRPIDQEAVTSLIYGLRFVENDFSCPGLYRALKSSDAGKVSKVLCLLSSGDRFVL